MPMNPHTLEDSIANYVKELKQKNKELENKIKNMHHILLCVLERAEEFQSKRDTHFNRITNGAEACRWIAQEIKAQLERLGMSIVTKFGSGS